MVRQNLSFKIDEVFITVLSLPIEKINFSKLLLTIWYEKEKKTNFQICRFKHSCLKEKFPLKSFKVKSRYWYFIILVHLTPGLIRAVAFGERGLLTGGLYF
jgi:hypothetical protein